MNERSNLNYVEQLQQQHYSGDKDGMAAPLFGQVKEFDGEKEEWSQYVKQLDHFFEANEVADVDKKRSSDRP